MKRHPLALMITLAMLQGGCSYKDSIPQHQNITPSPEKYPTSLEEDAMTRQEVGSMAINQAQRANLKKEKLEQSQERKVAAKMAVGAAMSPPVVYGMMDTQVMPREERDKFEHFNDNPIKQVATDPVSTFSLDVDTGSYALVRQFIQQGRLPASDAVRVEELINYFSYQYPKATGQHPFASETELSTAPWQPEHYLLRIGVQAQDVHVSAMPPANLVFLVDVSGSMSDANKLPLVISSLQMLTQQLRPQDKVSLVVYAGRTEVVLEPTAGNKKADIQAALGRLQAGGSTAGTSALAFSLQNGA
jgi:Ca-activated chloride channel family protein